MKIKVQTCWMGGDSFCFRALVCGGLRVSNDEPSDSSWSRKTATKMLDLLETHGFDRSKVRFVHV